VLAYSVSGGGVAGLGGWVDGGGGIKENKDTKRKKNVLELALLDLALRFRASFQPWPLPDHARHRTWGARLLETDGQV
jgi:hypothetical protein